MIHETDCIELKSQLTDDIEKTVVAFLNASGGELRVGVNQDGTYCDLDDYDKIALSLVDRIKNNILPFTLGLFSVKPKIGDNGKEYLEVKIASGSEKPFYIKKYGMSPKGCYIRVGTQNSQMSQEMIDNLYSRRSMHTLHKVVSPRQNLTFSQLKIYYDELGYNTDSENFLHNLDFYTEDGKFNYAAYLMADSNAVSIKVVQYRGTDKIEIRSKYECGNCSLIKAAYAIMDKLELYNETAVEITYPKRIETPLVEKVALREAVLNSLIHNDYIRGAYPLVEFFSDRVEVTSSGGLPLGQTREDFFKGKSLPRNREIMRIFSNMDLGEQLGSGMKRILQTYSENDFEISDFFVTAKFNYNSHAMKLLKGEKSITAASLQCHCNITATLPHLNKNQKRIMELISYDKNITRESIALEIGVSIRTVDNNIKQLKERGLLERFGKDNGGQWLINLND
ncbi:MAG: putative DNA binding domain-containing protein [Erysipelotrichales bacterium]|nr:putative DNA binding domain-containing protein [Erysipelotrichales bacterium]